MNPRSEATDTVKTKRHEGPWDREISDASKLPANPLVSVFLITYQQVDYIAQALDGILMQKTTFPIEICIGEDGSTDGTREICMEYAKRHPDKIRLFLRDRSNPARAGYAVQAMYNAQETYNACRGVFVALLEGDDYWTDPEKLQKQVAFMNAHPECALVHHRVAHIDSATGRVTREFPEPADRKTQTIERLFIDNMVQTCSVLLRHSCLPRMGEEFREMKLGDHPMFILAAQHGSLGYLDETMSVYRLHGLGYWSAMAPGRRLETAIQIFYQLSNTPALAPPYRKMAATACLRFVHEAADWIERLSAENARFPELVRDNKMLKDTLDHILNKPPVRFYRSLKHSMAAVLSRVKSGLGVKPK
jgi:glycosyltransferase involved in cell wall biosynthesis